MAKPAAFVFAFFLTPSRSLVLLAILFIVLLLLSVSRRREEPVPGQVARAAPNRGDSRYWKAGAFYVNRNDPAIFVKKRTGIGYTFNFGHWAAWVVMAILMSIPIVARFLETRH